MMRRAISLVHAIGAAATIALAGCARDLPAAGPPAAATARTATAGAASGALLVTPAKLNFTTKAALVLTIREGRYHGAFTVAVKSAKVVGIPTRPLHGPGPVALRVLAKSAGTTIVIVRDALRHAVKVPVTVTTGVVVVQ